MTVTSEAKNTPPDHGNGEHWVRPRSFEDFVGQRAIKDNLRIFIAAARARSEALDHVLFSGPPGLGKTTLAQITAQELGVGFRATSGPVLNKGGDLAAILTNLDTHDVLFIDEIHRLPVQVEEILYPSLEDFQLDLLIGDGPAARSVRIDLPAFTLIGATTRLGLLSNPLRDRFGIPIRLDFYDTDDLTRIVTRAAERQSIALSPDGAREIAFRARGTPRIAVRLLRRARDFAQAEGTMLDRQCAAQALSRLEVDPDGLDSLDRRYLDALIDTHGGGPVGADALAASLSETRDAIEEVIEPFLLRKGYIARTARGRIAAPGAYARLGMSAPDSADLLDTLDE